MTVEKRYPAEGRNLHQPLEVGGSTAALWINDATGQIVEMPIGLNIPEHALRISHQEVDRKGKHGRLRPSRSISWEALPGHGRFP
jgi:hypothetical protein